MPKHNNMPFCDESTNPSNGWRAPELRQKKKVPKRGSGRHKTTARGNYHDDENIYNLPSIRQSIEEDRK